MTKAIQEDVKPGITSPLGEGWQCVAGGRVNRERGWIDDGEPHIGGGFNVWDQGALATESPATSKAIQSPGSK
ncbi:hypothetical protein E4U58_004880 [Claviceps cyperi]|nr:hypothetical protein E4U58_004880 [Claviceps cyperi]